MSVRLVPDKEIHFHGQSSLHQVAWTLTISNDNANPVAYRIKTTAPKLFNVHPVHGVIGPGDSSVVAVKLYSAIGTEDSLYNRRSDKFLVQSTFSDGNADGPEIIRNLFNTAGDEREIYSQKLWARYLPLPEEEESTTLDTNHPIPVPPPSPPPSPPPNSQDRNGSRSQPSLSTVHADPERPLPPPGPTESSKPDLEQQLRDAQEENRRLRALLARSHDGGSPATDAVARTHVSPPKCLASGVESMVAELRNFIHPLASPGLPDDGDS